MLTNNQEITIIINGQVVKTCPELSILQTARQNNIYIPSLCYHEKTGSSGKCRVCIVEIEEIKGFVTACNTTCQDGMRIKTDSPSILEAQKLIVDLILSSGHHNCLTCESNGACELQDCAYYLGIDNLSFNTARDNIVEDNSSEFISVNRNKCISCGRCVLACNHTVVNEVLDFSQRGRNTSISFDNNLFLGDSTCVQCGECVQICPVGCLSDKNSRFKGRPWEVKKVETVCPYCGVGCKLYLHVNNKTQKIIRVTGVENAEVNNGMLCVKGRYAYDFINSSERLTHPLLKTSSGEFKEISWNEAISIASENLKKIKSNFGAKSIAGLCSAKITNEENFLFMKFMRKEIGSNHIDHCARLCHASTITGLSLTLGSGAMTNDLKNIDKTDLILIIGSDITSAHPVISYRIKKTIRENKTKLIVIDPKRVRIADYANIYCEIQPGSDVLLLNSIMHVIIENEWYNNNFIKLRTEGFNEFKDELLKEEYSPENVSLICGISSEIIIKVAHEFSHAKVASIFYAMGITQHHTGTNNVINLSNLQLLCGNFGKLGGGLNPLRGQCNVQGACDMGSLPNVFSGYQRINIPEYRDKFEKAWNCKLSEIPGLTLTEIIESAYRREIKAMYIVGENPLLSDPDLNHVAKALHNLEFLIVQDIFLSETAKMAHLVLPSACFAEKEGHFTNTERRVQRLNKAINPPGEAKADWEIFQTLAKAFSNDWNYQSAKDITKEINLLTPTYQGITWDRTAKNGIQWPCPTIKHPGTPILHQNHFSRGLGLFKAVPYEKSIESADKDYPYILTTGRTLQQYHTGTMTRKTQGINNLSSSHMIISVDDAKSLGLSNSEIVKVTSRRGSIEIQCFITKRIRKGVVFIPFHFHEAPVNLLTLSNSDPMAKIPELKICVVNIKKL